MSVSIAVVVLGACSPALDWRTVELEGLRTVLPCKPDRAARDVVLGELPVRMSMAGCEAQGALFAISQVAVPVGTDAADLAWVTNKGSVFHLAVYAKALDTTLTEPPLVDLQWR